MIQRETDGHRQQMDGLRFVAFLGVFIYHGFPADFEVGKLGVHLFFSLSGFLITRILVLSQSGSVSHDLGVFYVRRVLRIFPLYYGVLVALLLLGKLDYPVWQFLYAQNLLIFSQETWIAPYHFWSLCVEEQFYLTYPLILLLIPNSRRVQGILMLIGLGSGMPLLFDYLYPANPVNFVLLPTSAQYLLWGCFAGLIDLSGAAARLPATGSFFTGWAIFVVGLAVEHTGLPGDWGAWGARFCSATLIAVGFALVVLGLWRTTNRTILRLFSVAPVAYLGKISYGLYVFHMFSYALSYSLIGVLPIPGLWRAHLVLAFLITVTLAALSWHLYECPINKLKRYFPYLGQPSNAPVCAPVPAAALATNAPVAYARVETTHQPAC